MTKIGNIKEKLSDLVQGVSEVLKASDEKPILVRDSISEKEAAYLDAVGIRDTGGPDSFRKRIELVWRLEQHCGWRSPITSNLCCFAIGWLLMMNSGWIGGAYAAAMADLAGYLVVLLSFCYAGRGAADFRILLGADQDSLLSHASVYEAFPLRQWIICSLAGWTAVIALCYLSGISHFIRIFAAGIFIVLGARMLLRGKIECGGIAAAKASGKKESDTIKDEDFRRAT